MFAGDLPRGRRRRPAPFGFSLLRFGGGRLCQQRKGRPEMPWGLGAAGSTPLPRAEGLEGYAFRPVTRSTMPPISKIAPAIGGSGILCVFSRVA